MRPSRIIRYLSIGPALLGAGFFAASACAAPATSPATSHADADRPQQLQNIYAHGADAFLWVAQVTTTNDHGAISEQTSLSFRRDANAQWQRVTDIPARVVGVATLGTQLATLLEDGEWNLYGDEGAGASGQPLPGGARLLALANDGATLWAVGAAAPVPATQAAATQATSLRSSPPDASVLRELHLTLFVRKEAGWQPAGGPAPPQELPIDAPLSLALVEHVPYIAIARNGDSIEVWQQMPGGWHRALAVAPPPAPRAFKLVTGFSAPTLWIARPQADQLVRLQHDGSSNTTTLGINKAPVIDRTAVYANGSLREISVIDDKLMEQNYDRETLKSIGELKPIALSPPKTQSVPGALFEAVIAASLVLAIFSSARRRRESLDKNPDLEGLILADLGRRLIAGLIDALPFAAPGILLVQMKLSGQQVAPQPEGALHADLLSILGLSAFAIYLIHTAISETLTRRTIGKYLMGLRVVRVDGGTPDYSSLLIRNFLRVVDLGLVAPLAFIIFSPLRQRIGDVAGGTVVIRDRVRPEGNLIEPQKTDAQTSAVEPPNPQGSRGSTE